MEDLVAILPLAEMGLELVYWAKDIDIQCIPAIFFPEIFAIFS